MSTLEAGVAVVVIGIHVGMAVAAFILSKRNERSDPNYYVMCVTARDQSRGYVWSGPYETEAEAHEEIADSRRFVGRRDELYVVDKRSYPPSKV